MEAFFMMKINYKMETKDGKNYLVINPIKKKHKKKRKLFLKGGAVTDIIKGIVTGGAIGGAVGREVKKKYQNLNDQNIAEIKAAKFVDFEIYKISEDIEEAHNLLAGNPNKKVKLQKKLMENYRKLLADSHVWTVDKSTINNPTPAIAKTTKLSIVLISPPINRPLLTS